MLVMNLDILTLLLNAMAGMQVNTPGNKFIPVFKVCFKMRGYSPHAPLYRGVQNFILQPVLSVFAEEVLAGQAQAKASPDPVKKACPQAGGWDAPDFPVSTWSSGSLIEEGAWRRARLAGTNSGSGATSALLRVSTSCNPFSWSACLRSTTGATGAAAGATLTVTGAGAGDGTAAAGGDAGA